MTASSAISGAWSRSVYGAEPDARGDIAVRLVMAEGVEKVRKLKVFETIIQNSGLRRINIATSATHTNNSCAKLDGPDFFNTLSQEATFTTRVENRHGITLGIENVFLPWRG